MKIKITLAIMAMAFSMMPMAYADGFETLVFKSVSGETYSVETRDLEIYYKDGELTFNNDERKIPVASLVSMEFSEIPATDTAVEKIFTEANGPATIFSIDGIIAGKFASVSEAYRTLKPGLYVVRFSNGETYKIKVEK